jgi:hypothetical protein
MVWRFCGFNFNKGEITSPSLPYIHSSVLLYRRFFGLPFGIDLQHCFFRRLLCFSHFRDDFFIVKRFLQKNSFFIKNLLFCFTLYHILLRKEGRGVCRLTNQERADGADAIPSPNGKRHRYIIFPEKYKELVGAVPAKKSKVRETGD